MFFQLFVGQSIIFYNKVMLKLTKPTLDSSFLNNFISFLNKFIYYMHEKIICLKKEKILNSSYSKWKNPNYLLDSKNHISIINRLYLGEEFNGYKDAKREINKKISSYRQQDIKKGILTKQFVSLEDVLERIVVSKLKCFYCREQMLLLFNIKKDMKQWTLDRLDNSIGHTKDNVVICCLKCNLERRCQNDKKFLFTKQMKIIKKE